MDKGQYGRRDRLIQEKRHDTYHEQRKLPEPTVCSECGAVFLEGRWAWWDPAVNAHAIVCPACQRIKDNFPAGTLEIRGGFFGTHREEINNLIHNLEDQEKKAHPMERLMAIAEEKDCTLVTTTGIHLARRIGESLKSAYQGELDFAYGDGEKSIRLTWLRD
ncbi:MAG: BCAM0308 family protein [Desulfurivibrionaceae bacterium]|jgi:NMD protein affecting ribosome stability and mRNA decay